MKDTRFAKFVVALNGAVPMALLGWDAYHYDLGANPTNSAIRTTGLMSLIFLVLSLTVTPLQLAHAIGGEVATCIQHDASRDHGLYLLFR